MAVELVPDSFSGRIGARFQATPTVAGTPFELELSGCDVRDTPSGEGRTPFSLIFLANSADFVPQQIVNLANDELGEVALFLVPLGPEDERMRYEAVIS